MDDQKVAVLLEDLQAQFRTFGEGLLLLNEKADREFNTIKTDINNLKGEVFDLKREICGLKNENRQEHQQLKQMVQELNQEVQVEIKRVK